MMPDRLFKLVRVFARRIIERFIVRPLVIIWRALRPTLIHALAINRQITESDETVVRDENILRTRLDGCSPDEREHAIRVMLSLYQSDENRVRGIESKAFASIRFIGIISAADLVLLTFALRGDVFRPVIVVGMLAISLVYISTGLVASVYVARPYNRYVLSPQDILPPKHTAKRLARLRRRNTPLASRRSNLTDSSLFDALRAFIVTLVAIVVALI